MKIKPLVFLLIPGFGNRDKTIILLVFRRVGAVMAG